MQTMVAESEPNRSSFTVINTKQEKSVQSVKVIELIRKRTEARERFYSIQVSHSDKLVLNFNEFTIPPLFTSVAWHDVEVQNLEIDMLDPAVQLLQAITSTPTLLHLICFKQTEKTLDKLLKMNLANVLALRGDIVDPTQTYQHAIDLVRSIKHTSPGTSLSVGGYPDIHPESSSLESDIKYLHEKVNAGADFIFQQPCFSSTNIINFIKNCRNAGIEVPIIPGIFVPSTYNELVTMCRICKIRVPVDEFLTYKSLKDEPKAFQDYAVENAVRILNDLFHNDGEVVMGVQFFSLENFVLLNRVTSHFDFK